MKEWIINFRLEDSTENKARVALLMKHAWLKHGGKPGGMEVLNMSDFMRFLLNYYRTHEIDGR
jgi:hypothetical protein